MIRAATHYDIEGLVELFCLCDTSGAASIHWLKEVVFHLSSEESFVIVAEYEAELAGFFIGRVAFEPTLNGKLCIELHWYSRPGIKGFGAELRRQAECIARERGALKMLLHCPDERVEKLVARAGYSKTYAIYGKALTCH